MRLFRPVSSTAAYIEYRFDCELCLDNGCIRVPTYQLGKITITTTQPCPRCNNYDTSTQ